jgi:succinate-semialdehyde dehydrogenase / glutarate-semialdehyde dehydrogenase
MFVWTCIQALLTGNSMIFKTSKECILTGKLIEEIMNQSGMPEGVWSEVYGSGELGDALVQEDIDFITFTGSTRVGR